MTDAESNAVTNAVTNNPKGGSDDTRNAVTNIVTNGAQTRPVVVTPSGVTTLGIPNGIPSKSSWPENSGDLAAEADLAAERTQSRLTRYLGRRPPRFAAPGELSPDLAAWAKDLLTGATGNLVITGNVGTGKSWSAWRIGEELLRHGYRGRIEIATAYRVRGLATPPADTAEIARLTTADLLVLDDVGAVRVSDWDADHLYALIDDRWAHQRPTAVIMNTTGRREDGKTALQALLGDRAASRIADGVTIVTITGPDRRRTR